VYDGTFLEEGKLVKSDQTFRAGWP